MRKILSIILVVLTFLLLICTESVMAENESKIELSEQTINTLKEYMEKEVNVPSERIEVYLSNFKKHPDIGLEFEQWVILRKHKTKNPIKVEGYTAKDIAELAPFLSGLGVYNYMISLREYPDYALLYIKWGFPRYD